MRVATLLMIAAGVATSGAVSVAHPHDKVHAAPAVKHHKAQILLETNDARNVKQNVKVKVDNTPYDNTPYVRQLMNGQWEAGVPNYEDLDKPMYKREFSAEGEAKAWAYSKTGAAEEIKYAGGDDDEEDPTLKQVEKESQSTNNSNNKSAEGKDELERPIIDAKLAHMADKEYHTAAAGAVQVNNHGATSKATADAAQAAKKAAKDAAWTKSVSARHHNNGGNDLLTEKQKAKTQGAKDAKSKRAQKLTKLGAKTTPVLLAGGQEPNSASMAGVAGVVGSITLALAGFLLL